MKALNEVISEYSKQKFKLEKYYDINHNKMLGDCISAYENLIDNLEKAGVELAIIRSKLIQLNIIKEEEN